MNNTTSIQNDSLRQYMESGYWSIEGWCDHRCASVLDLICQSGLACRGGACEIGVHHGKFYMMLNHLISAPHYSYAIDVFDQQELNIDNSGRGNLEIFKANMRNLDQYHGANTRIIQGDSTDHSLNLVKNIGAGTIALFSIDGGHTTEHTINDLRLAEHLICNDGLVIVDDITHYCWLGVIEGVIKYLNSSPVLVPFAIGYNKLWMCKLSYYSRYFNTVKQSNIPQEKAQPFVGRLIATL